MDDDLLGPGGHDGGGDGHFLDVDAVDGELVVLADLLVIVEVLLGLDWSTRGCVEDADAVEPFDTTGTNVAHNESSDWVAVNLGERLSVHLEGKKLVVWSVLRLVKCGDL